MKLVTKDLLKKIPNLYETEKKSRDEVYAQVKYFNPCGSATWYGIEFDPANQVFFGYVDLFGDGGEYGYFSLKELESIKLPYGLTIERDLHFKPIKMSELLSKCY